jgi:hypothetical protein
VEAKIQTEENSLQGALVARNTEMDGFTYSRIARQTRLLADVECRGDLVQFELCFRMLRGFEKTHDGMCVARHYEVEGDAHCGLVLPFTVAEERAA